MVIQMYFNHLKEVIDRYATTHFVVETGVHFDIRPGDQGYAQGTIRFVDGSTHGSLKF